MYQEPVSFSDCYIIYAIAKELAIGKIIMQSSSPLQILGAIIIVFIGSFISGCGILPIVYTSPLIYRGIILLSIPYKIFTTVLNCGMVGKYDSY